ncbi:MAG TPA: hypothetical protein VHX92_09390 [Rhizomicrobium sp.]|jgi:hypothetical protein|nr:hypothetical protein [Rhizomicrobium sp.]
MKAKFLIAAAALVVSAAPAFANTPSADPFGTVPSDQAVQSAPDQNANNGDAYVSPFGDHLRQNQADGMRPSYERSRNNLEPPRMDASGVPDPRI